MSGFWFKILFFTLVFGNSMTIFAHSIESCREVFGLTTNEVIKTSRLTKLQNYRDGFKISNGVEFFDSSLPTDNITEAIERLATNGIEALKLSPTELRILPNRINASSFMRIVNKVYEMGFSVEVVTPESLVLGPKTTAKVNSVEKKMYLRMDILDKLDDPRSIATLQHEYRHIVETFNGSDASRMYLTVVEQVPGDILLNGYGSPGVSLRLDEPFAYFQGSGIQQLLSGNIKVQQLVDSRYMTMRIGNILRRAKDFNENFTYNPKSGFGMIEIFDRGKMASTLVSSDKPRGRYKLEFRVGSNLEAEIAAKLSQELLKRYLKKLGRLMDSYDRALDIGFWKPIS